MASSSAAAPGFSSVYQIRPVDMEVNFSELDMVKYVWPFMDNRRIELTSPAPAAVNDPSVLPSPTTAVDLLSPHPKFHTLRTLSPTLTLETLDLWKRGRDLAPYVCRIESSLNGMTSVGTGFLLSDLPGCILTNSHVIPTIDHLRMATFTFFHLGGEEPVCIKHNELQCTAYRVVFPVEASDIRWWKPWTWSKKKPKERFADLTRPDVCVVQFNHGSSAFTQLQAFVKAVVEKAEARGHEAVVPPLVFTKGNPIGNISASLQEHLGKSSKAKQKFAELQQRVMERMSTAVTSLWGFVLPSAEEQKDILQQQDAISRRIDQLHQGSIDIQALHTQNPEVACVHFGGNEGHDNSVPASRRPRQHALIGVAVQCTINNVPSAFREHWEKWNPIAAFDQHNKQKQLTLAQLLVLSPTDHDGSQVVLNHATLTHRLFTRPGASGAPVFTKDRLVGIEHRGFTPLTNVQVLNGIRPENLACVFTPFMTAVLALMRFKLLDQHEWMRSQGPFQEFLRLAVASVKRIHGLTDAEADDHACPLRRLDSGKKYRARMKELLSSPAQTNHEAELRRHVPIELARELELIRQEAQEAGAFTTDDEESDVDEPSDNQVDQADFEITQLTTFYNNTESTCVLQ